MAIISKFECSPTTKDAGTIIAEAYKTINLNTIYQRKIVWNDEKQSLFINSVINCVIPNPVIFNTKPGVINCIDGKQRITSLVRFKKNEIYVELNNIKYFYSKIPREYKTERQDENIRILSLDERHDLFDTRLILINQYKNLSYKDEVDVFNRIQNGMVLTSGEKLIASADKEEIGKIIKLSCDSIIKLFSRYPKFHERGKLNTIITNLIFIIDKNKLCSLTLANRQKYIKTFNTVDEFKKKFNVIEKLVTIVFDKELLNHQSVRIQNINKNYLFALSHFIHNTYPDLKINKAEKENLRKNIHYSSAVSKEKIGASSTADNFSKIYSIILNKHKELDNITELSEESEEVEEVVEVVESEEEIKKPKKIIKTKEFKLSKASKKKLKKHNKKTKRKN